MQQFADNTMEKPKTQKKDIALELVKLCGNYCAVLEQVDKASLPEFLDRVAVSLMAIYQKTFSVNRFQTKYESETQHYLTEKQYNKICNTLKGLFGKKDVYVELINPTRPNVREQFKASIAEDLTDIYQDFYDFVQWYSEGTYESINDSIIELLNNFDKYWGIKLLNVIKAIHVIRYLNKDAVIIKETVDNDDAGEDFDDDDDDDEDTETEEVYDDGE